MDSGSSDGPIAVCHEWITTFGGSEQVAVRMAKVLQADSIYTFTAEPTLARELFPDHAVRTTRLGRTSLARKHWQWFLPLMPFAWARLNLTRYGIVITSSHSAVNAIHLPPSTIHISYCHTPMRYAWEWRSELSRFPPLLRPVWPLAAALLRRADRRWAQGVTRFIANSHNVAARIRRNYGRDADVLYPPIDTEFWSPGGEKKDFFLFAGRLVPYKRPGVAVATATALGVPLVVAGSGPLLADLRRKAGPNITFIENPSREHLRDLYRETKALVFPGVEDFGMTLVEAQACGTPVIASAQGGALEAVNDGVTGYLYEEEGIDGLSQAIDSFDPSIYEITSLRVHAEAFAIPRFDESLRQIVDRVVATGQ